MAIAGGTTEPLADLFIGIGILIMAAIAFAVLRMAAWLQTKFGLAGINIMTSIMGFLLIRVAVQFIYIGASTWVKEILQPLAK